MVLWKQITENKESNLVWRVRGGHLKNNQKRHCKRSPHAGPVFRRPSSLDGRYNLKLVRLDLRAGLQRLNIIKIMLKVKRVRMFQKKAKFP